MLLGGKQRKSFVNRRGFNASFFRLVAVEGAEEVGS